MWIMAAPAGEIYYVVDAFRELRLYCFKMVLGIGFIITMTVHAKEFFFKPGVHAMRKSHKIIGVTVGTTE